MTLLIDGARKHEKRDLVDARHRLKACLAKIRAFLCKVTALEMGLRERRVIVAPKRKVPERAFFSHELNHVGVHCVVLLAASHPIGECFFRDQPFKKSIFLFLTACESFNLILVTQNRVAEDIGAVAAVVLRFLVSRRLGSTRCTHD